MEKISYLKKFTIGKPISEKQFLATELYEYFEKKLPFGRIMAMIGTCGVRYVRETLIQIKKGDAKDKLALFIYKCKTCRIIWE